MEEEEHQQPLTVVEELLAERMASATATTTEWRQVKN
jgi:hypothetical protein